MPAHDPLHELAMAAREGDDRSIEQLVRLTQPAIWRLCSSLGSTGEVEDLVSETYMRALRSLGTYRGESSVRTWLLSIARNVCADQVRSRVRERRLLDRLQTQLRSTTAFVGSESHTVALLENLHPDRREAFVLTQLLGLSYDETAVVLDVPVGTVRSRVARARMDLRTAVTNAEAN